MNYQQTIGYLFSQLPMFHRIGPPAYKANLDNTLSLSEHFQHPERLFPSIHIAGTNGKGSVASMLAAVFQQQGYKTGLATSPHLKDFRERIRVDGKMIPRSYVAQFVTENKEIFDKIQPSFFELTIALSFQYFAHQQVDIAIVETGLGGRLDSTNIITPEVSVITNIGMDHVNLLGDTLEKIAVEKAGIIKKGVPVVIGRKQEEICHVFENAASRMGSQLFIASENYRFSGSNEIVKNNLLLQELSFGIGNEKIVLQSDLAGRSQHENVATVLQVVDIVNTSGKFHITDENLKDGLSHVCGITGLKGRWQMLGKRPVIICDTAHNSDGIGMVVGQLMSLSYQQLRIVFGMVDDKDISSVLALMPANAIYYFCRPQVPRGLDAAKLKQKATEFGLSGKAYPSVSEAFQKAKTDAGSKDLIFIGGSTFVVAEVV